MFKCPKCDYESENPGNCPTDNEVLVESTEVGTKTETEANTEQGPDITPPTTDESVPTEEDTKPTEEQEP